MNSEEFLNADLVDICEALARGEVASEFLTQQCLERLARIGSPLNAVMELDRTALEAARSIDRRRAKGERLGPLAGVPLAHKDLFYRAGKRCTCGSRIRDHAIADTTATALASLPVMFDTAILSPVLRRSLSVFALMSSFLFPRMRL